MTVTVMAVVNEGRGVSDRIVLLLLLPPSLFGLTLALGLAYFR